jgi:Helix-turn-helix domain
MSETTAVVISVLLHPREAAKVLQTTVGTLAVWRSARRYALRYVRVGRRIFYRSEDVQAFIEARTCPGVAETQRAKRARG